MACETLIRHEGPLSEADAERLYAKVREAVEQGGAPRAVMVAAIELVQNLRLHGGSEGAVCVAQEAEHWRIETRNRCAATDAARVLETVARVNAASPEQLRQEIRERRRAVLPQDARGAGLGLLELRRIAFGLLASCDPEPGSAGKSVLVIEARLSHKEPVADLDLAASTTTPKIHLPGQGGEAWISGACYPENAFAFFQPVFEWLRSFRGGAKGRPLLLNVKLDYFNTSSSKCLLDLFQSLQEARAEGVDARIRWHYCEDDSDMRDSGEEFAQDLSLPFDLVAY